MFANLFDSRSGSALKKISNAAPACAYATVG